MILLCSEIWPILVKFRYRKRCNARDTSSIKKYSRNQLVMIRSSLFTQAHAIWRHLAGISSRIDSLGNAKGKRNVNLRCQKHGWKVRTAQRHMKISGLSGDMWWLRLVREWIWSKDSRWKTVRLLLFWSIYFLCVSTGCRCFAQKNWLESLKRTYNLPPWPVVTSP